MGAAAGAPVADGFAASSVQASRRCRALGRTRLGRFAQDAQVSPAGAFPHGRGLERGVGGPLARNCVRGGRPLRRLPDGVGEGQKVIGSRLRRRGRHGQAQDFPAPRHRQRPGVLFAQIVTMRFRIRSQRTQDSCGVRVHVRQSCHRRLAAGRPGTLTNSTHDITDYSPFVALPCIRVRGAGCGPGGQCGVSGYVAYFRRRV